jgi:hypothetical protein
MTYSPRCVAAITEASGKGRGLRVILRESPAFLRVRGQPLATMGCICPAEGSLQGETP